MEHTNPDWSEYREPTTNITADHVPDPNDPPWNLLVALGVWVASVLAIIVFPGILLAPYLAGFAGPFADNAELTRFLLTDPTAIILQVAAIFPAHIVTIAAAWFVVTHARTFPFRETLGWRSGGMTWWHYIVILVGFFAVASVVGYYLPEQDNDLLRILRSSRTAVFLVAIMATFTAPLVEEVIYRGLLYSAFHRAFGTASAVAIVTFLFALVHLPQYYPSVSTMILLTLLSLILTLIRAKTGNLLPCIILHTIFNGLQSAILLLQPYLPDAVEPVADPSFVLRLL